jgi:hypothetical protein
MLFQPIASIGYDNYDWFDYNFTTQALQDFVVVAQPLPDDSNGQLIRQLSIDETLQKLQSVFEANGKQYNQIGWYGLPAETRSKMIRYHTTKMMINLRDTTTGNTLLKVPENSLHIVHFTRDLDADDTPNQVTHAAQTFSLTN